MTGASYKSHHIDVVVVVFGGVAVERNGEDTRTLRSQSGCEGAVLIR